MVKCKFVLKSLWDRICSLPGRGRSRRNNRLVCAAHGWNGENGEFKMLWLTFLLPSLLRSKGGRVEAKAFISHTAWITCGLSIFILKRFVSVSLALLPSNESTLTFSKRQLSPRQEHSLADDQITQSTKHRYANHEQRQVKLERIRTDCFWIKLRYNWQSSFKLFLQ